MEVKYVIDSREFVFEYPDNQVFETGENIVLSNIETDLIFNQSWYDDGYKVLNVFENKDFEKIKKGITSIVKKLVSDLQINVENFCIEDYHSYITNDEDHFKIVNKTRDLFAEDFDFDIMSLIKYFEKQIGVELTDCFPSTGKRLHIIVRINRPFSNDFNPPHQDLDNDQCDPMINVWIPICGVDRDSSLCVVKGSHLIPMNKIEKSVNGGLLGKNSYSVRMIKSWNGSNEMTRVEVKEGEVLFFTPFLIHGMAYNQNQDKTRVALEFRLFQKR
jgi:hypothetical protein